MKFRRDALQGLERCAGEVVTDILNIIETCDPDEAQMRLIMKGLRTVILPSILCVHLIPCNTITVELPTFADYFRQLREADASVAKQALSHWCQFLEGPPNRPNEDDTGLIAVGQNYDDFFHSHS